MSFQVTSKKIRAEQEKELKTFRESLKQETKLMKQEVDLLPKSERKETLKARREALEADQNHREQLFLSKLNDTHESSLKRLSDTHREKIALLDRQFLQQKQQLMRAREAAIWVSPNLFCFYFYNIYLARSRKSASKDMICCCPTILGQKLRHFMSHSEFCVIRIM